MTIINRKIQKLLPQLAFFYGHLRYKLFILLSVSILVGLLDGFGLAMFLPLLELVADDTASPRADKMGNLAFILQGLEYIGLSLSLTAVLLTMMVFFILKGLAKYFVSFLGVVYQQFFIAKIRVENIDALSNYSYSAFVNSDAGMIQNTLSGEVQRVILGFRSYNQMLQQLILIVTYSGLAFMANPEFSTLVLVGGVLSNFLFIKIFTQTKRLSNQLVLRNHDFQGLLLQGVSFFKYLKATGAIWQYSSDLKKKVHEIETTTRNIGALNSIMAGVREPLMITIVVSLMLLQVNMLGGALSTIILSLLFFYRGLTAVTQFQTSYNNFLSYSGSITNMQDFMADLRRHKTSNGSEQFSLFERDLCLQNITFAYQGEKATLRGITLNIKKNQTFALVGESGSGKTTLMNIISGLLKPKTGEILIDGVNLKYFDINTFQKRIGYITQEPVIFDDTIFNNVTFWAKKNDENLQRFWAALRKAQIHDFVSTQDKVEDSKLGNNGINLSGGQKQRFSIARELYKEVDFLLMDEATSALDSETEHQIQRNIELLRGSYTIIIIAHRLSTIRAVDKIVILNSGQIEQLGTYEDLIENSDSFRKMVQLQEL